MSKILNITDLTELHDKAVDDVFQTIWDDIEKTRRMYRGKHFTDTEEKSITAEGRVPYSIPIIETKINTLLSQQMLNRNEWRVLGRNAEDEIEAEVRTHLFKYIEELNDYQYIESEVYRDMLVKRYAVVERSFTTADNPEGDVKLTKLQYDEVVWDTNCKRFNISRYGNWIQKFGWVTRDELISKYPDKKEIIQSIPADYENEPKYKNWCRTDKGKELIKVVWHYQRQFVTTYNHYFRLPDNSLDFVNTESKNPDAVIFANPTWHYVETIPVDDEYIEMKMFSSFISDWLDSKIIKSKKFPLEVFFCFFDDGEFWSVLDYVKYPQWFFDRTTMQIDYGIGVMLKNSYEVQWDALHPEDQARWNLKDTSNNDVGLGKQLVKGGAFLRRLGANPIVSNIPAGRIPDELFRIWQVMMAVLEEAVGGRNVQGLKESANESGYAIRLRQEQALAIALVYIDNLRRAKKQLGEGILEDIDMYYTEEKTIRILGDNINDVAKAKLIEAQRFSESPVTQGYGYLQYQPKKVKLDLIVDKTDYSPTMKEKKFNMLMMYNQLKAQTGSGVLPMAILGKYMDIDPVLRAKIEEWEIQQQQLLQQQMQQQKDTQTAMLNLEMAKHIAERDKDETRAELNQQKLYNEFLKNKAQYDTRLQEKDFSKPHKKPESDNTSE